MPKKKHTPPSHPIDTLMSELKTLLLHPPRERKEKVLLPDRIKILMGALITQLSIAVDSSLVKPIDLDKSLITALLTHEGDVIKHRALCIVHLLSFLDPSHQEILLELGVITFLIPLVLPTAPEPIRKEASSFFLMLANSYDHMPFIITHGGMPTLLLICHDTDRSKQTAALNILQAFSSVSPDFCLEIIRANGIQQLLKLLPTSPTPLQLLILKSIENAHGLEEAIETIGSPELICLIHCLKSSVLEIETQASVIMANLFANKACCELVEGTDAIQTFISRLDAPMTLLRSSATAALFHLALHLPENKITIAALGAIPKLVDLLDDINTRSFATKTLGVLAIHPQNAQLMLSTTCVVPKLLQLLGSEDLEYTVEVLNALLQIIHNDHRVRITASTISQLLRLITPESPLPLRQKSSLFLIHFEIRTFQKSFLERGGLEVLLSIINDDSNMILKAHALLACAQLTDGDTLDAKKSADTLIREKGVDSFHALLPHPLSAIGDRAAIVLINLISHNPKIVFNLDTQSLRPFLVLLDHPDPTLQHRTKHALLLLSRLLYNALALQKMGALSFLISSLNDPEQQDSASIALLNIASQDASEICLQSREEMRTLLKQLQCSSSKLKKRSAEGFAHLATRPQHASFIKEIGGHLHFIHLLRNPHCAASARTTLDHIARIGGGMARTLAIYEYAFNGTIQGIIPELPVPSVLEHTVLEDPRMSEKSRAKSEQKIRRHRLKIDQLKVEIQALCPPEGFHLELEPSEERRDLRKTVMQLQQLKDSLKEKNEAMQRIERLRLEDMASRIDAYILQLYNGPSEEQLTAAKILLTLAAEPPITSALATKMNEDRCRRLQHHTTGDLQTEVTCLITILFPRPTTLKTEFGPKSTASKCSLTQSSPELKTVFDIQKKCSNLDKFKFDTLSPFLVGSQVQKLQHGMMFDESHDWDLEFFCSTKTTINPAMFKDELLIHILPRGSTLTHWNTFGSYHELGFRILKHTKPIDIKFSIYAEDSPSIETCVSNSQINRRLTNRAGLYDLEKQVLYTYDPQWRCFTGEIHEPTIEDLGYALYDLAIERWHLEKEESYPRLLIDPELRYRLIHFFQSSDLSGSEPQRDVIENALKPLRKKLSDTGDCDLTAKRLIRAVLRDFEIELPPTLYCRCKSSFFSPVSPTYTPRHVRCKAIGNPMFNSSR